jgi:hypothetical protein
VADFKILFGHPVTLRLKSGTESCQRTLQFGSSERATDMTENDIRNAIDATEFEESWSGERPPFDKFVTIATKRLKSALPDGVSDLDITIAPYGKNRVRIDGSCNTSVGPHTFYAEIVWLPNSKTFRGTADAWESIPPPTPKTIDEFIAALDVEPATPDADPHDIAMDVAEGVDEQSPDLPRAYRSIFALFERVPGEDFGTPGDLVRLMFSRGEYEAELRASLARCPTFPALMMAHYLVHKSATQGDKEAWLEEIRRATNHPVARDVCREFAQELVAAHEDGTCDDA